MEYKSVLIYGLGISGFSSIRSLKNKNCHIHLLEEKEIDSIGYDIEELKSIGVTMVFGSNDYNLELIDLIVKSPGIPMDNSLIKKAENLNIPVISDLELSYLIRKTDEIIAITGTNGKTSTTTLIGQIFKNNGLETHITGNIGLGTPEIMSNANVDDVFVIECSSFQLESINKFTPKIGLILNLKEDHLNWHGSFKKYIDSKIKIFKNQGPCEYSVVNYDDLILRKLTTELKSEVFYFSTKEILENGVYIDDNKVKISHNGTISEIIDLEDIHIITENALGAIAVSYLYGINVDIIRNTISKFYGLEHRIEYIGEISGVSFYNDSKGTNPDSTIKALNHLEKDIILIAGGYDKGADYNDLAKEIISSSKHVVLMGETRYKILESLKELNFNDVTLVDNMYEAVKCSYARASKGDKILLSPACASWGMYKDYEERGRDFKNQFHKIKGK